MVARGETKTSATQGSKDCWSVRRLPTNKEFFVNALFHLELAREDQDNGDRKFHDRRVKREIKGQTQTGASPWLYRKAPPSEVFPTAAGTETDHLASLRLMLRFHLLLRVDCQSGTDDVHHATTHTSDF